MRTKIGSCLLTFPFETTRGLCHSRLVRASRTDARPNERGIDVNEHKLRSSYQPPAENNALHSLFRFRQIRIIELIMRIMTLSLISAQLAERLVERVLNFFAWRNATDEIVKPAREQEII